MGDSERSPPSSGLGVGAAGSSLMVVTSDSPLESDTRLLFVFLGELSFFGDTVLEIWGRVSEGLASEAVKPRSVFCRSFFIPDAFPDAFPDAPLFFFFL